MTRSDTRTRILAACLSALAGYVDAIGYLSVGGLFVSFMSGNSTRFAVDLIGGSGRALAAAGLIGAFVAGVMAGHLTGYLAGRHRRPTILVLLAALLATAAALGRLGFMPAAIGAAALAMGAENSVFEEDGEVRIGLTYMTGTLVKFGQRLAGALLGGDPFAPFGYLVLWAGLVAGAMAGAATFPHLGLQGLWIAAGAALLLAGVAVLVAPERPGGDDGLQPRSPVPVRS